MCHSVCIRQRCYLVPGKAVLTFLCGGTVLTAPDYIWSGQTNLTIQGQTEEYLTGSGEGTRVLSDWTRVSLCI